MKVFANVLLALALLAAVPAAYIAILVPPHANKLDITFVLLMVPFWLCLMVALGTAIAAGAFDGLASSRGVQAVLVLAACTALLVVNGVLYLELFELEAWLGWLQRPLARSVFLLPLIATVSAFFVVTPALSEGVWPARWRVSLAACGGLSLLLASTMLAKFVLDQQSSASAAVEHEIAVSQQREASNLAEVKTLDPIKDFRALLLFTNSFQSPEIRAVALGKLNAHPDLIAALTQHIGAGRCDEALYYLEGSEVPISPVLAEQVRVAIVCMAERARKTLHEDSAHYDVNFDSDTRRVLAVADRFKPLGVDYLPAMRAFRAAMDEPNPHHFVPKCRATIDKWIVAQRQ